MPFAFRTGVVGVAKRAGTTGTAGPAAAGTSPGDGGTLVLGAMLWNQHLLAQNISRNKELDRNKERKVKVLTSLALASDSLRALESFSRSKAMAFAILARMSIRTEHSLRGKLHSQVRIARVLAAKPRTNMVRHEILLAILRRAPIFEAHFGDEVIGTNTTFMLILLDVRPARCIPNEFV